MSKTRNHDRWSKHRHKLPRWTRNHYFLRTIRSRCNQVLRLLPRSDPAELDEVGPLPHRYRDVRCGYFD